jgi:hypothetical protein
VANAAVTEFALDRQVPAVEPFFQWTASASRIIRKLQRGETDDDIYVNDLQEEKFFTGRIKP